MNKLIFDALDMTTHYKTTTNASQEYRIFKSQFLNILGYDDSTGGFIVLQKGQLAVSNETILEVLRRLALNPETKKIERGITAS